MLSSSDIVQIKIRVHMDVFEGGEKVMHSFISEFKKNNILSLIKDDLYLCNL